MLKLIFRATILQERPKYDTFQKALLCTLASGKNCNRAVFRAGQYL